MENKETIESQEHCQSSGLVGYVPFGEEWIKEMTKLTKMELIEMVKRIKTSKECALYTNYELSCQALKDRNKERST